MTRSSLQIVMLCWSLGCAMPSFAQCPSSDSLHRQITRIWNSESLTEKEKLQQLLPISERIKECPYLFDSTHALLLRRIGVLYSHLNDYSRAVEYTKQAIDIIRRNSHKASINVADLSNCYYNLHLYFEATRQEVLKREAIDSCIAIDLRIGGDYTFSSYLFVDKVAYLLFKGEYILCIQYAGVAEDILQEPKQMDAKCNIIVNHANALIILKRYREAESLLNRNLKAFQDTSCRKYLGSLHSLFGVVYMFMGAYQKALSSFVLSADYSLKAHYLLGYGVSFSWIGFLYTDKLNKPRAGLEYYQKALKYADSQEAILLWGNIGRAFVNLNCFDSAFYCFQKAFDMIKPGCNEKSFINDVLVEHPETKIISYVTDLLSHKGDAYLKQYKIHKTPASLLEALNVYAVADQLLNELQSTHLEMESKLFWRENTRRLYENAIEASYLAGKVENAFYFFEKSRSSILNAQLNEQRWLPEAEIMKQSQLQKEIYMMERSLSGSARNSPLYIEIQKEILENKQQLEALHQEIKATNPHYFQKFMDTTVVRLRDVQQIILKDHDGLVELFAGDSAVYVLIVEKERVNLKRVNKSVFDSLSRIYINYISNLELLNLRHDEFLQVAHQLYELIFPGTNIPKGRIIFSPDGKYFPLESLVPGLQPPTYFITDHAVSYTYSVRYLLHNEQSEIQQKGKSNFLGIAPIHFNAGWQLADLAGSDESLGRIDNNFTNATTITGTKATRRNFLDQFNNYRIIQLYTHATDSGSTGEPMIYFYDSTLSLSELFYGRKPVTELVVLSACRTGVGRLYNGEGVFNFNRGFAAMGVPSSISNLWLVESQATYRLTELFYQSLAKGLPADIAMQRAKKEFMTEGDSRRNQLPYLWAAPILVGDSNFVLNESNFSLKWLIIVIPLIILAVFWLWKRSQKSI